MPRAGRRGSAVYNDAARGGQEVGRQRMSVAAELSVASVPRGGVAPANVPFQYGRIGGASQMAGRVCTRCVRPALTASLAHARSQGFGPRSPPKTDDSGPASTVKIGLVTLGPGLRRGSGFGVSATPIRDPVRVPEFVGCGPARLCTGPARDPRDCPNLIQPILGYQTQRGRSDVRRVRVGCCGLASREDVARLAFPYRGSISPAVARSCFRRTERGGFTPPARMDRRGIGGCGGAGRQRGMEAC